jgi:hypothetical protein
MLRKPSQFVRTVCVISALVWSRVWATEPTEVKGIDPGEANCKMLQSVDFSGIQDAPTHVTEAKLVETSGGVPAHCRVRGYVMPQVGFEILLPAAGWNEKFIELGCGGFCGSIDQDACRDPIRRGYTCIASDMGHQGEGGLWAYNNLQAKLDWGYRGPHVVSIAGKTITQQYYSRIPRKSYFSGCSTGGRQAMVEAQRFPWDFDGIIAGAPPINFTANSMAQLWASLAVKKNDGTAILNPAIAKLVHKAVLAQCDLDDGIRDGIVSNPRECRFDPATLACKSGSREECLTDEQIAAVKKIYAGPFASTETIAAGGFMPGSELGWTDVYFSADDGPGFLYAYDTEKFRYLAFLPDAGPSWKATNLNFDIDYKRVGTMESLYSATNPDLRQFKHNGGKLLVYQGWNDQLEPPVAIADYYEIAERVIGSRAKTQEFFRLFMIPGMNHCAGGEGAWAIDYLTYLEEWVEHGKAPEKIVGGHIELPEDPVKAQELLQNLKFPLGTFDATFSRPVYPFPSRAKYRGAGDPNDAANFVPSSGK